MASFKFCLVESVLIQFHIFRVKRNSENVYICIEPYMVYHFEEESAGCVHIW